MTINLFCLPPAGSSAAIYARWNKLMPDNIRVIPIEYPGHGTLVKQALTDSPEALTEYVIEKIKSYGSQPFCLFGHSVGAALAWRVEQDVQQTVLHDQCKLLVISGRPEMEFTSKMAPKGGLDRAGLKGALIHYNAVPQELLDNDEMLDFFLPILSNDFRLNDNMLADQIVKTNRPLLAFYGEDDPDIMGAVQMSAWSKHSTRWLGSYALAGDHFFFNQLDSLKSMLNKIYAAVAD